MTTPILLTGGTGTLGRQMLPLLRAAGRKVRVLSRRPHDATDGVEYVTGDLATGTGIDAAVTGVETVVHCAGSAKGDDVKARHLVRAASAAGARHLVYVSVVGADRVPMTGRADRAMFGYYGAKRGGELAVAGAGLPWTTLRATQFHDLMLRTASGMAKLPVLPVPSGMRVQPVDSGEVAARMVELALGEPAGLVPDLGGPRVYGMDELIRDYLRATGKRRPLLPMRMPGAAAAAMRAGVNLTTTGGTTGRRTWEEFLAERS
ncbi:SDR family oxidoreductase [Phytohabitans kaempferiae]|uniref:SDR family oxidoreductase n=1 Tax=Phytohabitans kaempferiae TaxID=1620943 RepID=A0ABV6MGE1_9ACTN